MLPETQQELSTVAILGFQFGLYHVVAPLSFRRSICLASLVAIVTINATKLGQEQCQLFTKRVKINHTVSGDSITIDLRAIETSDLQPFLIVICLRLLYTVFVSDLSAKKRVALHN